MLDPQDREAFERQERRAAEILRRLKLCEATYRASARSLLSSQADTTGIRNWVIDVTNCLKKCGVGGARVLMYRLTRQQHSQANGFSRIAYELRMTKDECVLTYQVSLLFFLSEMDKRGIPDDCRQIAA